MSEDRKYHVSLSVYESEKGWFCLTDWYTNAEAWRIEDAIYQSIKNDTPFDLSPKSFIRLSRFAGVRFTHRKNLKYKEKERE